MWQNRMNWWCCDYDSYEDTLLSCPNYMTLTFDEYLMSCSHVTMKQLMIMMNICFRTWYSLTPWPDSVVDTWQFYDRQVDVLNDDEWSGFPFRGKKSSWDSNIYYYLKWGLLIVDGRILDMNNHMLLLKKFWQVLIWAEKVSPSLSPNHWEKGLRVCYRPPNYREEGLWARLSL